MFPLRFRNDLCLHYTIENACHLTTHGYIVHLYLDLNNKYYWFGNKLFRLKSVLLLEASSITIFNLVGDKTYKKMYCKNCKHFSHFYGPEWLWTKLFRLRPYLSTQKTLETTWQCLNNNIEHHSNTLTTILCQRANMTCIVLKNVAATVAPKKLISRYCV